jgi:cytochrome P450
MTDVEHRGVPDARPAETPAFPMARDDLFAPPEEYARLREDQPVCPVHMSVSGRPAWLVTRYEDVKAILADPRTSANLKHRGYPLQIDAPEDLLDTIPRILPTMDPPDHTVQRRLLIPEFTFRKVEAMRPHIQKVVDEHVDAILAGEKPADLVAKLSFPVPSQVICELLGVPFEDRYLFGSWARLLAGRDTSQERHIEAEMEMSDYLDDFITHKQKNPGDDLITRVMQRNEEAGAGLDHDALAWVARVLIVAGHDTTASMMSLAVVALLRDRAQLAELRTDPALMASAIEELLRYATIADSSTGRVATTDLEIAGHTIPAGGGIIPAKASANWDPTVFEDPERLDLRRSPNHHLAFGYGIHQCIAQTLARTILDTTLTTLITRVPTLALAAPESELPIKTYSLVHGVYELPVTW